MSLIQSKQRIDYENLKHSTIETEFTIKKKKKRSLEMQVKFPSTKGMIFLYFHIDKKLLTRIHI